MRFSQLSLPFPQKAEFSTGASMPKLIEGPSVIEAVGNTLPVDHSAVVRLPGLWQEQALAVENTPNCWRTLRDMCRVVSR